LREKLIQKDILISHLKLKFETYETEFFDKNLLLCQSNRKRSDYHHRVSISSLSTVSINYEYDKLLNEKLNLEDMLVKLKFNYANAQSQLLDYGERNIESVRKIEGLEKTVENQNESLKLKDNVMKALLSDRDEARVTDPGTSLDITIKKKIKKQSSLGNMFKGLFKK
jgi:predicted  nucleic acid-binding Zn-ribbon protein